MKQALAMVTGVMAFATFPLYAQDPKAAPATEVKDSGGENKIKWGKEKNGLVASLRGRVAWLSI